MHTTHNHHGREWMRRREGEGGERRGAMLAGRSVTEVPCSLTAQTTNDRPTFDFRWRRATTNARRRVGYAVCWTAAGGGKSEQMGARRPVIHTTTMQAAASDRHGRSLRVFRAGLECFAYSIIQTDMVQNASQLWLAARPLSESSHTLSGLGSQPSTLDGTLKARSGIAWGWRRRGLHAGASWSTVDCVGWYIMYYVLLCRRLSSQASTVKCHLSSASLDDQRRMSIAIHRNCLDSH
ncbi:hypothetical protein EJ05DRAFT_326516 [Pseudovirgaria hyperparasitica]|uniref:Uncharacterized protein n=1 Tax=Pseudovirgaria hyperparasitica TaxID=470096 RepID=A0A6A6W8E3_9PEZI|nr:uncharacterized protein EJ05DRAFT_326516 [Pseudovirgaria hyperparasitica]KAF2758923.1 hypothetical protein EJ05DRAFT_326516 [Pseudovirgaria hyperparasitica]